MRKFLLAAGAVSALVIASAPAQAVIFNTVGQTLDLTYNGFDVPDGVPTTISGLSATGKFTLTNITNGLFTFSYTIDNTSTIASRVSIFGFDTMPDILGATTPAGGEYDTVELNGNVPNLTGPDNFRVCFSAGSNCAGGSSGGIFPADAPVNGTFTLNFGAGVTSFDLTKAFVRYQSVGPRGADSATGLGTAVPEPATWAMMLGGFGLLGAAARRRRSTTVTYA
jgi:hypothetical protein